MSMANEQPAKGGKELTGRKVLAITVSFFAVILAVNLFMAYKAVGTFPGLEVKNSYVASQQFNRNLKAQLALEWDVSAAIEGDKIRLDIVDAEGKPVTVGSIDATIGRPTEIVDDQDLNFERAALGYYLSDVEELRGGNWYLRLKAYAEDGTLFQQRITIYIAGR